MDWTTIIVAVISSFGVGVGSNGLSSWLMRKPNKKGKEIANDVARDVLWQHILEEKDATIQRRDDEIAQKDATIARQVAKIEELYKENNMLRDERNNLKSQRAVLAVLKCNRANCAQRRPPFGKRDNIEIAFENGSENENNGNGEHK